MRLGRRWFGLILSEVVPTPCRLLPAPFPHPCHLNL